jgi:serine protease Do
MFHFNKKNSNSNQPVSNNTPNNTPPYNQNNQNYSNPNPYNPDTQSTNQTYNNYLDEEAEIKEVEPKVKKSSSFGSFVMGFLIAFLIFILLLALLLGSLYYTGRITNANLKQIINPNSEEAEKELPTEVVRERTRLQIINEDSEVIETVKKTDESVVSVIISRDAENLDDFFGIETGGSSPQRSEVGAGTGFIVSKEGHIITNRHVVGAENNSYTVVFSDGAIVDAEILGRDTLLDIAVLKIEPGEKELKPLPIGDSSAIQVGQTVLAIGNSLGRFGNSVSRGIVSGLDRTVIASDGDGGSSEILNNVIQTDASINPGNSGGPLLDIYGNVIGVNVARAEADNIAFAIPIDDVKIVLESVIETGQIQRPFIGIRYREITPEIAKQNNLKKDYGIIVISENNEPAVAPESSAQKAGIKQGDIILEINENQINIKNPLQKQIQKYRVGDKIKLKVLREDKEFEVTVELGLMPQ